MPRKAILVQVELHIQAVTCPGVWLCPSGKLSLQIHMLGSSIQSRCVSPVFPIVIDEKFVFSRSYFDVGKLGTLQKILNKDTLCIELIQWQNCENGNVLATFQTSLAELLFPESKRQCLGNTEIDLLMEPMPNFPGILAPKIEVGTKTIIQDEICPTKDELEPQVCHANIIASQKSLRNGNDLSEHQIARQKPVCHTKRCRCALKTESFARESESRPPFVVRKVPDDIKYLCQCNDCKCERINESGDAGDDNQRRSSQHGQQHGLTHSQNSQLMVDGDGSKKKPRLRIIHTKTSMVRKVPKVIPVNCCKVARTQRSKEPERQFKTATCECGDEHTDNCVVCAKYKHYFESRSIKSQKRQQPTEPCQSDCQCQNANQFDTTQDDVILSNYPSTAHAQPQAQPSMAQRLHTRLSETLARCDCHDTIVNNCGCGDCICENLQECGIGSLSQFYKKFYSCGNK